MTWRDDVARRRGSLRSHDVRAKAGASGGTRIQRTEFVNRSETVRKLLMVFRLHEPKFAMWFLGETHESEVNRTIVVINCHQNPSSSFESFRIQVFKPIETGPVL